MIDLVLQNECEALVKDDSVDEWTSIYQIFLRVFLADDSADKVLLRRKKMIAEKISK